MDGTGNADSHMSGGVLQLERNGGVFLDIIFDPVGKVGRISGGQRLLQQIPVDIHAQNL
ncbi:hypothetical protein D1872_341720 [compost metagenome]